MPDIEVPFPAGWVNVYALLGVTVGTELIIQNKDDEYDPVIQEKATSPLGADVSGTVAPYGRQFRVKAGSIGCFARGRLSGMDGGPGLFVNVQVAT